MTNKCEACGTVKIVYYREYCPLCYKPKKTTITSYNLFECMYYLEALGNIDFREKLWSYITSTYDISNDSYITISYEPYDDDTLFTDGELLVKKMFENVGIKENSAVFLVSW